MELGEYLGEGRVPEGRACRVGLTWRTKEFGMAGTWRTRGGGWKGQGSSTEHMIQDLGAGAGISDCIFIDTRSHCRYDLMCFKTLILPAHVEKGQQGGYTSRSSQEIEITPGISG